MAQISIQVDARTLKELEITAAKRYTTISKWIEDRIHYELKRKWPENYFSLFGSLDEDDLSEPPEISFRHDAGRENQNRVR